MSQPVPTTPDPEPESVGPTHEELRIVANRIARFKAMGFDLRRAGRLAAGRIDYHEAERLIAKGCPLNLVEEILE